MKKKGNAEDYDVCRICRAKGDVEACDSIKCYVTDSWRFKNLMKAFKALNEEVRKDDR